MANGDRGTWKLAAHLSGRVLKSSRLLWPICFYSGRSHGSLKGGEAELATIREPSKAERIKVARPPGVTGVLTPEHCSL